jgi:hypothetical protein
VPNEQTSGVLGGQLADLEDQFSRRYHALARMLAVATAVLHWPDPSKVGGGAQGGRECEEAGEGGATPSSSRPRAREGEGRWP